MKADEDGLRAGKRFSVRFEGTRKVCEFLEADIIGPGELTAVVAQWSEVSFPSPEGGGSNPATVKFLKRRQQVKYV